ncbi:MAG: transcription antitermination factor NusB [Alphaproteobacteria bacterium]
MDDISDKGVVETSEQKPTLRRRSIARLMAVQAFYQMELTHDPLEEVLEQFRSHHFQKQNKPFSLGDKAFFVELVRGGHAKQASLDPMIQGCISGWSLDRLDHVVLAILRLGSYELSENLHLSSAIILNEYIDITRAFFDDKEPAFVNGVLDCLIQKLRPRSDESKQR